MTDGHQPMTHFGGSVPASLLAIINLDIVRDRCCNGTPIRVFRTLSLPNAGWTAWCVRGDIVPISLRGCVLLCSVAISFPSFAWIRLGIRTFKPDRDSEAGIARQLATTRLLPYGGNST